MSCTTILVGKDASYDGSTMIARNMYSGSGEYTLKKMISVSGKNPPKKY
ncbi:MAG: C69 family dipeptidase, partial [Lachnospiraceae bacterium]|nr:C69 family dipeptidase [Lachnospiraceae bacterium]